MECSQLLLMLLVMWHTYCGHSQESYKPVLTVTPNQSHILIGQTVIFRCEMKWVNVTYIWFCDGAGEVYASELNEYIIRHVKVSHSCTYRCFGSSTQWPRFSYWSNAVNLTVIDVGEAVIVNVTDLPASKVSLSTPKLISFLLASSPYVLVSVILPFKCYRAHRFSRSLQV